MTIVYTFLCPATISLWPIGICAFLLLEKNIEILSCGNPVP